MLSMRDIVAGLGKARAACYTKPMGKRLPASQVGTDLPGAGILLAALLVGCAGADADGATSLGDAPSIGASDTRGIETLEPTQAAADPNPALPEISEMAGVPAPEPCFAPLGVDNEPQSISAVVDLLNAMPKPVSMPCFIEALARPLELHASRSVFSAQPAVGSRSPRVFLFSGPLIMSVVPAGIGREVVEFGELLTESRSLKGEIQFPVEHELTMAEPFERLMFNDTVTACAFCHADEQPAPQISEARAFTSEALRPRERERVALSSMLVEQLACDHELEPERCALLDALFGSGNVVEHDFPMALSTF
jgi:hypothetical protein